MTTLPSYSDPWLLAESSPIVLLAIASDERRPEIADLLRDLAACDGVGRRHALAALICSRAGNPSQPAD